MDCEYIEPTSEEIQKAKELCCMLCYGDIVAVGGTICSGELIEVPHFKCIECGKEFYLEGE